MRRRQADLAERYGYVNRSLPDADLDGLLMRLPRGSPPSTNRQSWIQALGQHRQLAAGYRNRIRWNACVASMGRPATQQRIETLLERGFANPAMQKIAWEISWKR